MALARDGRHKYLGGGSDLADNCHRYLDLNKIISPFRAGVIQGPTDNALQRLVHAGMRAPDWEKGKTSRHPGYQICFWHKF